MQRIASLSGVGWLRTREAGSAVANYSIDIYRGTDGQETGVVTGQGALNAAGWALSVMCLECGSTLVLGNGERVEIKLLAMGSNDTTATFAITGAMPRF